MTRQDRAEQEADAALIARHDPERVLREVRAKRSILAQAQNGGVTPPLCGTSSSDVWGVFADHPDFEVDWLRPELKGGQDGATARSSRPRSPDGAGCSSVVQERKRRAAELPWPRAIPKGRPCRSAHVVGHREDDHV